MVYRGKPSKACERCRARRLKCDLRDVSCGQCIRADVSCSGYRDIPNVRFLDENQAVAQKVSKKATPGVVHCLPLSVDFQARGVFFAYFVNSSGACWDFMRSFYHPSDSPSHVNVAIEAVSLAYLWHQLYSETALAIAREKYVLALRMTHKALQVPGEAVKMATLITSLLLDLFEKITGTKARTEKSWTSHINGALDLVQVRGLDSFHGPVEFGVLVRLINHHTISCLSSGSEVPGNLITIRTHIINVLGISDYTLHLSEATVRYAKLRGQCSQNILSTDESIKECLALDADMQALEINVPDSWKISTTVLQAPSDRAFDLHFDTYPNRNICLALNMLRVMRILLNETIIQAIQASTESVLYLPTRELLARRNIQRLAEGICASVPQYTDCERVARYKLPQNETIAPGKRHTHTPIHQKDCYTLIMSLYTAGRCEDASEVRNWAIAQLHYIGEHFCLRDAEAVAKILEGGEDVCPWDVYVMLGSYAFTT